MTIKNFLNKFRKIHYSTVKLSHSTMMAYKRMFPKDVIITKEDDTYFIESERLRCDKCGKTKYEENEAIRGIVIKNIGYCKQCFDAL